MIRKIDTLELVRKIERLARERMAQNEVVPMSDLRKLKVRKSPRTLLVIEDDETIRLALCRLFQTEGYRVLAASDGTELTNLIDQSPIDLILLDVGLPWINGFELAEMMKAHRELSKIPLVFLSGRTGDDDVKRGFAVGADDYIKKQFDAEQMKKTVRTLIELNRD